MLREIVNSQNAQITFMRGFLGEAGADLEGEVCENSDGDGDADVPGYAIGIMAILSALCLSLVAALVIRSRAGKEANGGGMVGPKS